MNGLPQPAFLPANLQILREKARLLRIHSLTMTTRAGSGHPTTCLSAADIVSVLFFHAMRFDPKHPDAPDADRFVLSKGHGAPLLYAAQAEAGVYPVGRLATLREFSSELEGHPTPLIPGVDAATGSLGQGLSVGAGMALAAKRLEKSGVRVYVLLGDGEMAEGNVWEAAVFAAHYGLDNLTAIVDVNGLGQSERTMYGHDADMFRRRFEADGWDAVTIEGHDIGAIVAAVDRARGARGSVDGRPQAILARTEKGHGISFLADKEGWHGKPLSKDELARALAELGSIPAAVESDAHSYARPVGTPPADFPALPPPPYTPGQQVATREAYGHALARIAKVNPRIVAVDADVKNSTFAETLQKAFPDRLFQGYIAEQNMVSVGVGLAARGYTPFVATFACFLSRAYDQVRMAAISRSHIKLCGSHCGVSIGEDGPSQMGLEDLAMFRAIPGATVLYPSDAVSTDRLTESLARLPGIGYLRTTRPKTALLYGAEEKFPVPGFKLHGQGPQDRATIIAAGITLHEALKAQAELSGQGIGVRVIDLYCVKPIDAAGLATHVRATGGRVITVEDHFAEGGLGEAVFAALATEGVSLTAARRLAVSGVPHSGKAEELLDAFGISARHIAAAVKSLL
ncbi:MAG TPA: transketolase [Candidatus Acidoferrales bacterium]|nr:transketolase [Candidatus Acidoferrales bacterium]